MRTRLPKADHPALLAGALVMVVVVATIADVTSAFDRALYDSFVRASKSPAPDDIVIVSIDQKSLERFGRWPWRRSIHATMLDKLTNAQPAAVGFDIAFSEHDPAHPDDVEILSESIRANGKVVLPVLLEHSSSGSGLRSTLPLPRLARAAASLGHVDTELEADGVVRSAFLLAGLESPRWPALSLAIARVGGFEPPTPLPGLRAPDEILHGQNVWHRDHMVLVEFGGNPGRFKMISYSDIYDGQFDPKEVANRLILVGVTAVGLGDTVPTPVSAHSRPLSGVEFNAELLDNLLRNRFRLPASETERVILNTSLVVALTPFLLFLRVGPLTLALLIGGALLVAVSYLVFVHAHYWYPPSTVIGTLLIGFLLFNMRNFNAVLRRSINLDSDYHVAMDASSDGIIKIGADKRIRELNRSAVRILGLSERNAVNRGLSEVVKLRSPKHSGLLSHDEIVSKSFTKITGTLILSGGGSREIPVTLVCSPLSTDRGEPESHLIAISVRQGESGAARRADFSPGQHPSHDLPEHDLFRDDLRSFLADLSNEDRVAVIQFNLDGFRQINNAAGRAVGDVVLGTIGDRLTEDKAFSAIVGHLAGDSFVVATRVPRKTDRITAVVDHLRSILSQPIDIDGHPIRFTACFGISVYPEDTIDVDTLIRQSEIALQRSKFFGPNRVVFFSTGMQLAANRAIELKSIISNRIDDRDLSTQYQPIIRSSDGRIVGLEALMRLTNPDGSVISPVEFIPVAEENGQIESLGELQLRQIVEHLSKLRSLDIRIPRICINLSPRQISDDSYFSCAMEVLDEISTRGQEVVFELTENALLDRDELIVERLSSLRNAGGRLALDDFGTGYNSMKHLRNSDFSVLKIDMSFVKDLDEKPDTRAITAAIIGMAHSLRETVIAEGVETVNQYRILRDQQCDEIQGYLFCKPLAVDELADFFLANDGKIRIG